MTNHYWTHRRETTQNNGRIHPSEERKNQNFNSYQSQSGHSMTSQGIQLYSQFFFTFSIFFLNQYGSLENNFFFNKLVNDS
jgi:hypothetical protein